MISLPEEHTSIIRKATEEDLDAVDHIYSAAHDAEEKGLISVGWDRNIYPVRQTAEAALLRGDLFVLVDRTKIMATAIINQIQVPEYSNCRWQYPCPENEVMVLHTLVTDPDAFGHGYGRQFVNYYEQYARRHGCRYLRMDTNEKNKKARAFYKKLGFSEPGIVLCTFNGIPDVRLVCLEKFLF